MTQSKTHREKSAKEQKPKIVNTVKGKMLIPKPLDVDALLQKIDKGKLVTTTQVRDRLAKDFCADYTCPLTEGMFLWIAAETAEEDLKVGRKEVTPYWRVIEDDGTLNDKLLGGIEAQATQLTNEGHTVLPAEKGKPPRVKDFEKFLQHI